MIKKEPRMEFSDLMGFFLIYLGLLLFIVVLYLITINSIGSTAEVLNTVFMIFLVIYIGALILGVVYQIIHFLRWMVWNVNTPTWQKNKQ